MKRKILIIGYLGIIFFSLATVYYYLRIPSFWIERVRVSVTNSSKKISKVDEIISDNLNKFIRHRSLIQYAEQENFQVSIKNLWVDRCEVSQGDFYRFADMANQDPNFVSSDIVPEDQKYRSESEDHLILGKETAPANSVGFYDAVAYCETAGGRIPTSAEWNVFAAGKEGRIYPWGNEFKNKAFEQVNSMLNIARSCGSLPELDTPEGLNGLGSNVSEWTLGDYPFGKPKISGGNGASKIPELTSMSFYARSLDPEKKIRSAGFRCVYDGTPDTETEWETKISARRFPDGIYRSGTPKDAVGPELIRTLSPKDIAKLPLYFKGTDKDTDSLEVSKYEINVEEYRSFLNDPLARLGLYSNSQEPSGIGYTPFDWEYQLKNPHHPVRGINWWAATAFANWAGGELPSEEEWIQIYRGGKNRIYLYGSEFDPTAALNREIGWGEPVSSGMMAKDRTEEGVFDLMGNVSEWTRSIVLGDGEYKLVVKGGSYLLPGAESSQVRFSRLMKPESFADDVGIRVVFP